MCERGQRYILGKDIGIYTGNDTGINRYDYTGINKNNSKVLIGIMRRVLMWA